MLENQHYWGALLTASQIMEEEKHVRYLTAWSIFLEIEQKKDLLT
jgi:hypothetical protein